MLNDDAIRDALPRAFAGLAEAEIPRALGPRYSGKVREWFEHAESRALVTTDRLSAFDRVLGLVPYKGQVLNQLAAFWFAQTRDLVPNHVIAVPDPNVTVGRRCTPYPVEVVVRGYITGVTTTSLWYHYERGARELYGARLPDGLRKNDPLPEPLITPTTKAAVGHDERLTPAEVVSQGHVPEDEWNAIARAALAVFARGQAVARAAGVILVDTKYEFGRAPDGTIMLIDEIHTPDSSRFWRAESYDARRAAGQEPENFDKEFVRLWYADHGYRGDGEPPAMPPDLAVQAARRYVAIYEQLTGRAFEPAAYPAGPRVAAALSRWLAEVPA